MKILLIIGAVLCSTLTSYSQKVDCNDLLDYITAKGYEQTSLSSFILKSSWLSKVTAYSYEYKTYVVAEIKENEYSFTTKTYIFCGIPNANWHNFQFGSYPDSNSYGERFHKYIIDYQCDCD